MLIKELVIVVKMSLGREWECGGSIVIISVIDGRASVKLVLGTPLRSESKGAADVQLRVYQVTLRHQ